MVRRPYPFFLLTLLFLIGSGSLHSQTETDSLRFKIGQLVVIGMSGQTPSDSLLHDISQNNIGGIIFYYHHSNLRNPQQIQTLTSTLQEHANIPLLLMTDQEPGYGNLNGGNGFGYTTPAYLLGQHDSETETRTVGDTLSSWLKRSGINLDLAPVVDLKYRSTGVIGNRAFSIDTAIVSRHAGWFIDEFRQKEVLTCLKHFPGHGSSVGDSHMGFTDVTDTWQREELAPYRSLIDSGLVDMVMTAHIYNANHDTLHPATLSYNTITGILRDSLNYDGVVITDEMYMGAITQNYDMDDAVILALQAGADLILFRPWENTAGRRLPGYFIDLVERKVREGVLSEERILESYRRIVKLKGMMFAPTTTVEYTETPVYPHQIELVNYPNPFNNSTIIRYDIPSDGDVKISIHSLLGHHVATLTHKIHLRGRYEAKWNGTNAHGESVASGIYFVRVQTEHETHYRRLILMK